MIMFQNISDMVFLKSGQGLKIVLPKVAKVHVPNVYQACQTVEWWII